MIEKKFRISLFVAIYSYFISKRYSTIKNVLGAKIKVGEDDTTLGGS